MGACFSKAAIQQQRQYKDSLGSRPIKQSMDVGIDGKFDPNDTISLSPIIKHSKLSLYNINNISSPPTDYASGQFAHVFITRNLDNNCRVAIKKIDVGNWIGKTTKKYAEKELKILRDLNCMDSHINIIKLIDSFYEICYDDLYLHIVMEFIPSTLKKQIYFYGINGDNIPFKLIKLYSYQILSALNYINYIKNIIHSDLKPDNILVNPTTNIIKICDFGCSNYYNSDNTGNKTVQNYYIGSRYYRAPELLVESQQYSYEIDMWSFGCIFGELFLGNTLFAGMNTVNQLNEIINIIGIPSENELLLMNHKYEYNNFLHKYCNINSKSSYFDIYGEDWRFVFFGVIDMPHKGIDLISKILMYNKKKRLTPIQAIKHKYFDELRNNNYLELNDELKYPQQIGI